MPKFSGPAAPPRHVTSPVAAPTPGAVTHEGAQGFTRDARSDLFLLGISNFVGEQTFYEDAASRDTRFRDLIHAVTAIDAAWVRSFLPWLRTTMHMRSAPVVGAVEYAVAGGPHAAVLVDAVCQRPDEPAEALGYWLSRFGRTRRHAGSSAVFRGIARAATRLYDEQAALRYDGKSRAVRMADVIELTHPTPRADWQSELFKYLLDIRHHPGEIEFARGADISKLPKIRAARNLETMEPEARRMVLDTPEVLSEAGFSWERLSGWLQGPMDAAAWEAVIPSMGFMSQLRNLRNFDQAGVSDAVKQKVADRLSDPEAVARSRQFPIRFYSAWAAVQTMDWGPALERALQASLANVPSMGGRTLILVDTSASMTWAGPSRRSAVDMSQIAALFGVALAVRAVDPVLVSYSSEARQVRIGKGASVLRALESFPFMGGGTGTWQAFSSYAGGTDRAVIITDEQHHPGDMPTWDAYPHPIYTFNINGYDVSGMPHGERGRYCVGGLTDACFRLIEVLEGWTDTSWPWE